jgi:hypothetical protein
LVELLVGVALFPVAGGKMAKSGGGGFSREEN